MTGREKMEVFSFENGVPKNIVSDSILKTSSKHYKDGKYSLEWQIKNGATLTISTDVGYVPFDETAKSKARCSFVFWVYQEKPLSETMIIEFSDNDKCCCNFEMGMDFTGWRTVWVPYEQMNGTPSVDMNKITLRLTTTEPHTLYIDQIIPMRHIDARHHTRDNQVPFVNLRADVAANSHWMSLYRFSLLYKEEVVRAEDILLTQNIIDDIETVTRRYEEILISNSPYPQKDKVSLWWDDIADKKHFYDMLNIKTEDGTITGRTVVFSKQDAVYPVEHREELRQLTNSVDMKLCSDFLLSLAYMWCCAEESQRPSIETMYINTLLHLIDQGWDEGSGMGTVHHLGYSTRGFYSSVFLMRTVLEKNNLLEKVSSIAKWFAGAGRMFRNPSELIGESCDTFNTLLLPIIASVLMDPDMRVKHLSLDTIKRWLDKALEPTPGTMGPIKIDGATFHHANHYPAYAMGAFKGITPTVYTLSKTAYAINPEAHALLKKAIMMMRVYCNGLSWPVSLSARHPVGDGDRGQLSTFEPFYYMALAGAPHRDTEYDEEVVSALLRLMQYRRFEKGGIFAKDGYVAEQSPSGHFNMNYACSAFHRRENWLVAVRGHSRYIWGNETYVANNLYGRYVGFGSLQILSKGDPVNHRESGYVQKGWDWNYYPGTTAVALPMDKLRADVCNVDDLSGFEEMLISDKAFAGGVNIGGTDGAFALDLHSHAKYDATHFAKKSYFFFGNKVICVGSNIENDNPDGDTFTTIFQNYLVNINDPIYVGERAITQLNYAQQVNDCTTLYDNCGNGYYIPAGQEILVTRMLQQSCDQNTDEPTTAHYTKAVIGHGAKPKDASYEYCIFVDCSQEDTQEYVEKAKTGTLYNTLHADKKLHCVHDVESNATAYVLWEPCSDLSYGAVKAVSSPMLLIEKPVEDELVIAISDPDLRLYEGTEADQIDENGLQKEVSLYSREWRFAPSIPKDITVTLSGVWHTDSKDVLMSYSTSREETMITLKAVDGLVTEINLSKKI